MTRIIECPDCGASYETNRRNTKYCARCRLIKDLLYIASTQRRCWLCQRPFAPLDSHDKACGECSYKPRHRDSECIFCEQERSQIRPDVPVCSVCARDPQNRRALVQRLLKGQKERLCSATH